MTATGLNLLKAACPQTTTFQTYRQQIRALVSCRWFIGRTKGSFSTVCDKSGQTEYDNIAEICCGVMLDTMPRILIWTEAELIGLADAWGLTRIVTEIDEHGAITRELGFDLSGNIVHRHPGQPTIAERGVFDLVKIAASGNTEMESAEFDRLWSAYVRFPQHSRHSGNKFEPSLAVVGL
ncbi:MAG: hypothetical protein ACKVOS_00185 [Sphingorhabdus sp.]|uniref:hypothetical protein n=1 Tax=Sphingorhabdus sp. TaxID=1902408 RepID=UPI0038FC0091